MFCGVCQILTTEMHWFLEFCAPLKNCSFSVHVAGDRVSVSSTASTSSFPDMQSPKQLNEGNLRFDLLLLFFFRVAKL